MRRTLTLFLAFPVALACHARDSHAEDNAGLELPAGFKAAIFADDELAHDIYCLTIDAKGRVVVSGPGYVKILHDSNGDGKADKATLFAAGPKTGAQGMFFDGNDLLCVGDGGLLRYRDADGDGKADGKPQLLLKLKTGGEHHAHAIRKGPDGWFYLIAGNFSGVNKAYANLPTSPVRLPRAGVIFRLRPDFRRAEIVAHGYRNPYDFDFDSRGDLFTYDSDGERDVSLPWYRPTRVFQALPGSDAGWVSRSWKRPDWFSLDMPPAVGKFGRGSPTGVACYRHTQFPKAYRNAIFALDWTFGRILAVQSANAGASKSSILSPKPVTFARSKGSFGFAPTDIEVGPDGSLFVAVGGRGTRGGVYRIWYAGKSKEKPQPADDPIASLLEMPQPLSSWARARWEKAAKNLGGEPFLAAALDPTRPPKQRARAIEILTEKFGGLKDEDLSTLLSKKLPALVHARAAWSHARTGITQSGMKKLLATNDPFALRIAIEALLTTTAEFDVAPLINRLAKIAGSEDRWIRQAMIRAINRMPAGQQKRLATAARETGNMTAVLTVAAGSLRPATAQRLDESAIVIARTVLAGKFKPTEKLAAVRLLQLALGDVGPKKGRAAVFDGYRSPIDLRRHERKLDALRIAAAKVFPTENAHLDRELGRLIAMLGPANGDLLDRVLAKITNFSSPVRDIHYLIVASQVPVERTDSHREWIARGLVMIGPKIRTLKLNQDRNWDDRIKELYAQMVKIDPALPGELVRTKGFGQPDHVPYLSRISRDDLPVAVSAFVQAIKNTKDYEWNTDVVFVLGEMKRPEHLDLIRKQWDDYGLRDAILRTLAENPTEQDRAKFIEGLSAKQKGTVTAALKALAALPAKKNPAEWFALLQCGRNVLADAGMKNLAPKVVALLQKSGVIEPPNVGPAKLIPLYEAALRRRYPREAAALDSTARQVDNIPQLIKDVPWETGNVARGKVLFEKRACARCHVGRQTLGPSLSGVAKRFSRKDLLLSMIAPSRDVSSRYRTLQVRTTDGRVHRGLVVYESADGLILRTADFQTIRLKATEIQRRRSMAISLMPADLLKNFKPQDFADLDAYLRTLK